MPIPIDLTGQRFGRVVVLGPNGDKVYSNGTRSPQYRCLCDCGQEFTTVGKNLTQQWTRSCGCLRRELTGARFTKNREPYRTEYRCWMAMRARCRNPRNSNYKNYGGRGITIDPAWDSFEQFLADMGRRPSLKYTLERRDNNGNYCAENCYWATALQQSRNTRANHRITHNGQTFCIAEWAEILHMNASTLMSFIAKGGSLSTLAFPGEPTINEI